MNFTIGLQEFNTCILLMERVKLMRKSIAILICIMIMFIASCGNGGTGPEYRYEDFYIQEIHELLNN